jgi:hypothetical protein
MQRWDVGDLLDKLATFKLLKKRLYTLPRKR